MTDARRRLGARGEQLVARRLLRMGYRVVARNARTASVRGEIDLIAVDGPDLVFVEVKSRRADTFAGPEAPALAVGRRKQAKLRSLAVAWLRENRGTLGGFRDLRFDVVGVRFDAGGRVLELDHVRGAF